MIPNNGMLNYFFNKVLVPTFGNYKYILGSQECLPFHN